MSNLCKVLIVDDELLVRQGMKHHLDWEKEGFKLVGDAANGQEALVLIEQYRPHIVITDIVMPIMDGEELTRRIKQTYPDIEVIVLSSFSEFDYVKSSMRNGVVDYILKPRLESEELLQVLKKTAAKLVTLNPSSDNKSSGTNYFLTKALVGYEVTEDECNTADLFPNSQYSMLGCKFNSVSGMLEQDKVKLKERIHGSIRFALQEDTVIEYAIEPDSNTLIFLLNVDEVNTHHVTRAIQSALSAYQAEPSIACFAMSSPFKRFEQIAEVYKEQITMLFHIHYYFPERKWLMLSELPRLNGEAPKFNLSSFTEEVKRGKHEDAFSALVAHVQAVSGHYRTDVYEFKSFMSHIIFNITILLSQMEMEMKALEESKYTYFKAIDESESVIQSNHVLNSFLEEARSVISEHEAQSGNHNMKRLLQYIQEHYAEPLNLSDMAKEFHFNPSYLSSYFTTNNKEGFNEYLNRIRIEKAGELLQGQDHSISDISSVVGYSDHSYFCKVFKKFTSLSPSQYRRKYMK